MHAPYRPPARGSVAGAAAATILAGAWRPVPSPLRLEPEGLAAAVRLLAASTAAPLAWRRLRLAGLHGYRPARPLQWAYRTHGLETAGHEQHLQEVVPRLRAAGVEPILVKGWSLARLYQETGLRPYGDLDLCVRPDQLSAAMTVLSRPEARLWAVELHRGIPDLKDRTWHEAYRRSRLARLGDVDVRVLGAEDQLRLLSLHLMRHGACAPLWLCDLAVALEACPADFDWDYCLSGHRARAAWIRCWVTLACRLLGAQLGDRIPPDRGSELPPWLGPTVLARWEQPVRDSHRLDPIKSAYRRGLGPCHSRAVLQFLGLVGRLPETPSRLRRQWRRWRRPRGRPFVLHDEFGN
jgi:hypothetical protein